MDADLRKALHHASLKCSDAGVLKQLCGTAEQHGLSAKQLASKLSTWLINQGTQGTGTVTGATASEFCEGLARTLGKENLLHKQRAAALHNHTPASKWGARSWDELTDALGPGPTPAAAGLAPPGTPGTPASAAAAAPPLATPHSAFATRANSGQVVCSLNGELAAPPRPSGAAAVARTGPQLPPGHRYMMERLEDKVAAMQARMEAAAAAARAALGGAWSEPVPVGTPVQEESVFFGRIVSDSDCGALNAASLLLEGDQHLSEGARCPLDLSQLPSYRVFPGQVVVVRGTNPTGRRLVVRHLHTHLPPPPPRQAPSLALLDAPAAGGDGARGAAGLALSMAVAAGPFSLLDGVSFAPLASLLQQLAAAPPQVLVLLGPFVDVDNPAVASGMLDVTFQQLFHQQVVAPLAQWSGRLQQPCQVVLVPSVRDVHHHPTYPQPAFALPADSQLVSLQNPASFTAGGVHVSTTTQDVVRHLSPLELAGGRAVDRLAALGSHLLGQRCMYPLYPAHPTACLDTTADYALRLAQLPHLLLLPSDLGPYAKVAHAGGGDGEGADEVITINPGRLAKGNGGGTYARVQVLSMDGAPDAKRISGRCRVDIVKV